MAEIRYGLATAEVARSLAATMRAGDLNSVRALGDSAESAVSFALKSSGDSAEAFYIGGELAGVWGVVPVSLVSAWVIPWVITTPQVDKYKRTFFEESRRQVEELRRRYAKLTNLIDARYVASVRWARRLGFEVRPAVPTGFNGQLFHEVIWER